MTATEQRLVHALARATGLLRAHVLCLMYEDPKTSGTAGAAGLLSEIADFVIHLRECGIDKGDLDGPHGPASVRNETRNRSGLVAVPETGALRRGSDRVGPDFWKGAT